MNLSYPNIRTFDYLEHQVKNNPQKKSISFKYDGKWKSYSSDEVKEIVNKFSKSFIAKGVKKGDKISIISGNRPEWVFCDIGMSQVGAVNVPLYPTAAINDFKYILNDAKVKLIFVSNKELYDKIASIKSEVPSLKMIYSFENLDCCDDIREFLKHGESIEDEAVDSIKKDISSEDLTTIIYTSGTTGFPKGVMLSHKNLTFNVETVGPDVPLRSDGFKTLSFLPLCHIFERVVTFLYLRVGTSMHYAESIDTLKENIIDVKPNFFTCVPRLMEKIYEGMLAKSDELSGVQKLLYRKAFKYVDKEKVSKNSILYKLFNKLIYGKLREALGGNVEGIVTGAAALQPKIGHFFENIGVTVREGYGLTETAPVISFNRFYEGGYEFGTVGKILENIEIKLDNREGMDEEDGEILVKGDNVMMGYYNKPEITEKTIVDGWFHTGDIGRIKDGKFLKITDRVKDLFKTSGGKYIAPQFIENIFKENKYIEQILVIGNNRKFISALIVPSIENLKKWAAYKGYNKIDFTKSGWTEHPKIEKKINKQIAKANHDLGQVEKIKQFILLEDEWTIESGDLTPTLKPKRKIIEAKFVAKIEQLYN